MKKLTPQETRETFLDFMEQKGHLKIRGSSIIPQNDPSLLYINAGMAPMKAYFSGRQRPPQSDLCNIQPCIRTIDIEDVGDRHHLTFFEMLGSWSINNYFKDRAIDLAYELLTERFEFPKDKLYVTVFGGDKEKGIPPDEDSMKFWQRIGMPDSHIVVLGEDNFWSGGDTGPCGPCTEIFFDSGAKHGKSYEETGVFDTQNRYIEIWNAGVFMQYNRREDGTLEKLPFMSVDTGSGLERMVMTLNEKESVYDTDTFKPYMDLIADKLRITDEAGLASARRIADHIRAATLILSEGVIPGKDGRDYIPRRLIRSSASIAMLRGSPDFSFDALTKKVIDTMGIAYPKMRLNASKIRQVMDMELQTFERSVRQGVAKFDKITRDTDVLTGQQVFDLRSSLGMPLDLIATLAKERKIKVDMEGYKAEFAKHQMISRNINGGRK